LSKAQQIWQAPWPKDGTRLETWCSLSSSSKDSPWEEFTSKYNTTDRKFTSSIFDPEVNKLGDDWMMGLFNAFNSERFIDFCKAADSDAKDAHATATEEEGDAMDANAAAAANGAPAAAVDEKEQGAMEDNRKVGVETGLKLLSFRPDMRDRDGAKFSGKNGMVSMIQLMRNRLLSMDPLIICDPEILSKLESFMPFVGKKPGGGGEMIDELKLFKEKWAADLNEEFEEEIEAIQAEMKLMKKNETLTAAEEERYDAQIAEIKERPRFLYWDFNYPDRGSQAAKFERPDKQGVRHRKMPSIAEMMALALLHLPDMKKRIEVMKNSLKMDEVLKPVNAALRDMQLFIDAAKALINSKTARTIFIGLLQLGNFCNGVPGTASGQNQDVKLGYNGSVPNDWKPRQQISLMTIQKDWYPWQLDGQSWVPSTTGFHEYRRPISNSSKAGLAMVFDEYKGNPAEELPKELVAAGWTENRVVLEMVEALWPEGGEEMMHFSVHELDQLDHIFKQASKVSVWETEEKLEGAMASLKSVLNAPDAIGKADEQSLATEDRFHAWCKQNLTDQYTPKFTQCRQKQEEFYATYEELCVFLAEDSCTATRHFETKLDFAYMVDDGKVTDRISKGQVNCSTHMFERCLRDVGHSIGLFAGACRALKMSRIQRGISVKTGGMGAALGAMDLEVMRADSNDKAETIDKILDFLDTDKDGDIDAAEMKVLAAVLQGVPLETIKDDDNEIAEWSKLDKAGVADRLSKEATSTVLAQALQSLEDSANM